MKFTCTVATLKANLELVNRAIPGRPVHKILANFKIQVSENNITLSAFDLSIGIQSTFTANVEQEGLLTIPAKLFSDIINKLPPGEVHLDDEAGECLITIKSGTAKFKIKGESAEEYPELPIEQISGHKIPAALFLEGLKGTLVSCSKDESKYILQGVNLKGSADIEFASTDGHRVGYVQIKTENPTVAEFNLTIPSTALSAIERMLANDADIEIQYSNGQALFKSGNWILTSRTLEGKFPEYLRLIPDTFEREILIDREILIKSLDRISVFATSTGIVKFSMLKGEGKLNLSVENLEGGIGRESLDIVANKNEVTLGFNVEYFLQGLKSLSTSNIVMKSGSPTSPVILSQAGDSKNFHLLMPIDLRNQ